MAIGGLPACAEPDSGAAGEFWDRVVEEGLGASLVRDLWRDRTG
jgi:hypothetical protein